MKRGWAADRDVLREALVLLVQVALPRLGRIQLLGGRLGGAACRVQLGSLAAQPLLRLLHLLHSTQSVCVCERERERLRA